MKFLSCMIGKGRKATFEDFPKARQAKVKTLHQINVDLFSSSVPSIEGYNHAVVFVEKCTGSYNFSPPFGKSGKNISQFAHFSHSSFSHFQSCHYKEYYISSTFFLMETCPFKERMQPWSQPWVERDLPSKNLSHFPNLPTKFPTLPTFSTFPTEFPTFPTDLNAKILEFRAYKLCPTYAYGLTSVWRHFFMCWK